jgi:hypothetical protein
MVDQVDRVLHSRLRRTCVRPNFTETLIDRLEINRSGLKEKPEDCGIVSLPGSTHTSLLPASDNRAFSLQIARRETHAWSVGSQHCRQKIVSN